jgi:hypothetical protein
MGKKIRQYETVDRLAPHRGPIILTSKEPRRPVAGTVSRPRKRRQALRFLQSMLR